MLHIIKFALFVMSSESFVWKGVEKATYEKIKEYANKLK